MASPWMLWFHISPNPYISDIKTAVQSTFGETLAVSPEIHGGDVESFLRLEIRKDFLCLEIRKLWHTIPRNSAKSLRSKEFVDPTTRPVLVLAAASLPSGASQVISSCGLLQVPVVKGSLLTCLAHIVHWASRVTLTYDLPPWDSHKP